MIYIDCCNTITDPNLASGRSIGRQKQAEKKTNLLNFNPLVPDAH